MKYRIALSAILLAAFSVCAVAQPQRRIQERKAAEENKAVTLSPRAMSQYPAQAVNPTEVSWKRDIYRELDLKKESNAALYYPEEPLGDRVNFFTLVFNLIMEGKISAYEYRLDGNELFTESNKLDISNLLDKFYIYYKKEGDRYIVEQTDIPSGEVLKYYIKESNMLDQRTSNYQTRVTAICPVLMRSDVSDSATPYPMFWLNYDEISPYLSQTQVMTSSFNNTTNMSLDDYFVMRCYEGDIYKTSNLRNQPLADYCENDTVLKIEQQRIEQQLVDFEAGLWASSDKPEADADNGDKAGKQFFARKSEAKEKETGTVNDEPAASTAESVEPVQSAGTAKAEAAEKPSRPVRERTTVSRAKSQNPAKAPKTPKTPKTPKSSSSARISVHRR